MASKNENCDKPTWEMILKIAIAVLSAVLGAVAEAKVEVVGTLINGII